MNWLFMLPPEASSHAHTVDTLYFTLIALSGIVVLLVSALIVIFAFRYRRGSKITRERLPKFFSREVEIGWTTATLFTFLAIFWWASASRILSFSPPPGALTIRVVAKQWMWKFEHPSGAREIDVLHLPLGVPVRLSMTSQDVIHSFYVPAFREKEDVLPDRVTSLWFTPSRIGTYSLRCAEYCGTDHALMTGEVIVMPRAAYARWANSNRDKSLPLDGAAAFRDLGCTACHDSHDGRAPSLAGLYDSTVALEGGRKVRADEAYIERSILDPRADIVKGYLPIMPSYRGVTRGDEISALIAYIKSLRSKKRAT